MHYLNDFLEDKIQKFAQNISSENFEFGISNFPLRFHLFAKSKNKS